MPTYTLVEDSNLRAYLKEEGYGFVALISKKVRGHEGKVVLIPQNKGCDMRPEALQAAYDAAAGGEA